MSDDARPLYLFDLAVSVGDDPVAASELSGAGAMVRDVNRIGEDVAMGARSRLVGDVDGFDVDLDSVGKGGGHDRAIATRVALLQEEMRSELSS
jgi:hypothetical protein